MLFQYILLDLLHEELERHAIAQDVKFGDALLFSEIQPHKVDNFFVPTEETKSREILTLWLIEEDAVLDEKFIQEVIDFPDGEVINQIEQKIHIKALERFARDTKNLFETSQQIRLSKL